MDFRRRLAKPIYLHRPDQVYRRLRSYDQPQEVALAWGATLEVDPKESVGNGIARTGIHELPVTEAMWRLGHPTDLAVDVGANIGYFTLLLARRVREVLAVEPHPAIRERLARNTAAYGNVVVEPRAVSDKSGTATLHMPSYFSNNAGTASLLGAGDGLEVGTVTLDEMLGERAVGLLKLDVEGHELAALTGARRALEAGRVRDVFFEDHAALPTPVSERLEEHGYVIIGLAESLRGVVTVAPGDASPNWDAPTYLATLDPDRARAALRPRGWRCLRPR